MEEITKEELKEWMRNEWNYSSHVKYRHLFDVWWENALDYQLDYFKKQMYNLKHGIIGKTSIFFKK